MRSLLFHVATFSVLLHVALGCCWHHSHTWAAHGTAEPSPCPTSVQPCGAACHSVAALSLDPHHGDSDSGHGSDRHDRHRCDDDPCIFARTEQAPQAPDELAQRRSDLGLDGEFAGSQAALRPSRASSVAWLNVVHLPLRLHLRHQVLLR